MPSDPQYAETFIHDILNPWEELAPDAVLGEMTLAQFKQVVKPSLDARADIQSLDTQLIAARQTRNLADPVSVAACLKVVNGVKSSSKFGPNSALYKAMGYVTDSERKSGLVRPSDNKSEAGQPAGPNPSSVIGVGEEGRVISTNSDNRQNKAELIVTGSAQFVSTKTIPVGSEGRLRRSAKWGFAKASSVHLSENLFHHFAVHIGQAIIAALKAIGELGVIQTK